METDKETTNSRPDNNSSLPALTLVVLVGIIVALLYVGYDYISDDTNGSDELTNVALDTTTQQAMVQDDPEMLMAPQEADTSSQPAPVDLSQAEPPADVPVADATAEDVAAANRETTGKPTSPEKTVSKESSAGTPKEEKKESVAKAEPLKVEKKAEKPDVSTPKEEKKVERPIEKVAIKAGGVTRPYTVGTGETFYGVANRYNMKLSTLKALNPGVSESDVKAGVTKLNVKVMAVHTVGPGDVLRVVAQKYGVSKEALMRANKKSKDIATRGEKLIIPYPDKK
ncbi:LysM peptidoglycan-binding domain-containing protein [Spirosoma pomorum]